MLNIHSADGALHLLDCFFGSLSTQEIATYLGQEVYRVGAWLSEMVRLGAIEKGYSKNLYHVMWRLTPGAHKLLKDVLDLAHDYPEEFTKRMESLSKWVTMRGMNGEPDVLPINSLMEKLRSEWDEGESNVVAGPGA